MVSKINYSWIWNSVGSLWLAIRSFEPLWKIFFSLCWLNRFAWYVGAHWVEAGKLQAEGVPEPSVNRLEVFICCFY